MQFPKNPAVPCSEYKSDGDTSVNSLRPSNTHMAAQILANIDSGNGLVPLGTKPSP